VKRQKEVKDGRLARGCEVGAERAGHLVDHVILDVPVRQWVLSLPHRLLSTLTTSDARMMTTAAPPRTAGLIPGWSELPNDPNLVFSEDGLAYWHLIWTLNDENLKSRPCHDGISKKTSVQKSSQAVMFTSHPAPPMAVTR
jgi:hypothetical protein